MSRITWHPSYGWATPEQIDRIMGMGVCPERDKLIKEVYAQQKQYKGKNKNA